MQSQPRHLLSHQNPEEQEESQDPQGSRRWILEGPQTNHPWKFAIEKVPGAQSSNMEMHALFPVAVGVHREKPDGSHR